MGFPLFDFLAKRAELGPTRVAFEDAVHGEIVTYRELNRRSCRAAGLLASLGVTPADCVAVLCRNRVEFFELLFACAKLGAILVPLNWRMPAGELAPLLADCRARWLVHGSEDAAAAREIAGDGVSLLDLDDRGRNGFPCRRDASGPLEGRANWPADDTWYLLYTSGTTGKPKAVIQTYGMALANYVNIGQGMGLRGEDTSVNYLPLFHTGGINLTTLPSLILGARTLIMPGFDLERIVELLESGRLDTFFGVPAIYQAIGLHPRFEELDLTRVRCWGCGGAPMPEKLLHQYAARGALVLNGMGMTETGPTVFLMDAANAGRKIGSVGKPQLLSAVRLVGADGHDVVRGETGELWFSGPGITPGYYRRPDATADAFSGDGWLRSGDLGREDDEGYYYIVGRLKDMYISGGENVYAAEVEAHLAAHPGILEAAVTGVADEKWGEVGCAYLLQRPGQPAVTDEELVGFCKQRMAAYKAPKYFVRLNAFPRTAAGKVQKHLLPPIGTDQE